MFIGGINGINMYKTFPNGWFIVLPILPQVTGWDRTDATPKKNQLQLQAPEMMLGGIIALL